MLSGELTGEWNNPAADSWRLEVFYGSPGDPDIVDSIYFLSTGDLDPIRQNESNFEGGAALLPGFRNISFVDESSFGVDEFMKLLNWVVVSHYWITLYDLGQTSPTRYNETADLSRPQFSNGYTAYRPTNNIFVNDTLFQIFSSYARETVFPILQDAEYINSSQISQLPEFLPLNESNRFEPANTTLIRSYSCAERQPKPWFSALISVFTADYAVLSVLYTIFIFVTGWIQRRRDRGI